MQARSAIGLGSISGLVRPGGRFVAELLGMCAVMCVGGNLVSFAFFEGAKLLGYANLAQQAPELSILAIAVALSLPMMIYMAIRGHGWRHNLVMSAGTFAVAILLIAATWLAFVPPGFFTSWKPVFGLVCGPACAVMFVVMLFSFDMYTGRAAHRSQAQ